MLFSPSLLLDFQIHMESFHVFPCLVYIFVALNLPSLILYVKHSKCFRSFITIANEPPWKMTGIKWRKKNYGECAKRDGRTCYSDYELNCSLQIHFSPRKKCSFDCIVLVFITFALSRSCIHISQSEKIRNICVICCEYTLPSYQWIYGNSEHYRIFLLSLFQIFCAQFSIHVEKNVPGPWFLLKKTQSIELHEKIVIKKIKPDPLFFF